MLARGIDVRAVTDDEPVDDGDDEAVKAAGGASVGYLADVAAFARDLTRRGRVLPGVVDDPLTGAPAARWRSALFGVDLSRFEDLARAMPGVALAAGAWSPDAALRAA